MQVILFACKERERGHPAASRSPNLHNPSKNYFLESWAYAGYEYLPQIYSGMLEIAAPWNPHPGSETLRQVAGRKFDTSWTGEVCCWNMYGTGERLAGAELTGCLEI
jgi:hypothetical protein